MTTTLSKKRGRYAKSRTIITPWFDSTAHVHHWHIEPANGPTSHARCECGAEMDFYNFAPDMLTRPGVVAQYREPKIKTGGHATRHEDRFCIPAELG